MYICIYYYTLNAQVFYLYAYIYNKSIGLEGDTVIYAILYGMLSAC